MVKRNVKLCDVCLAKNKDPTTAFIAVGTCIVCTKDVCNSCSQSVSMNISAQYKMGYFMGQRVVYVLPEGRIRICEDCAKIFESVMVDTKWDKTLQRKIINAAKGQTRILFDLVKTKREEGINHDQ